MGLCVMEQWKPVVGYEGVYEVSDQGRIRRLIPAGGKKTGSFVKGRPTPRGYWRVVLSHEGRKRQAFMHRFVMEAFVGPCPEGYTINHKNGAQGDNRLENLEYLIHGDNVRHAWRVLGCKRNGELSRGEKNGCAILTEEQVKEIKRLIIEREIPLQHIADRFGVNRAAINHIRHNETWTHVPWPGPMPEGKYTSKHQRANTHKNLRPWRYK